MVWQKLGSKTYGSSSGDVLQTDTYTAKETSQWFSHGEANGSNNAPTSFFNGNETENGYFSTRQNWHATATGADTTSIDEYRVSDSSGNDDDFFKMGYLCDVSGEQKLFIAFSHSDHVNNGNSYASVGKIEAGIGTTITKYGQWDAYWEQSFQTWTNVTIVGGDTDLAVSSLANLTGIRTNTIFEQTDDVPAYYWYQTLDSKTDWFPQFQDSMTDSSVWTPVGSGLSITGGQVSASSVALNGNNRIYRSLGMTLSDDWVAEFDFNVTSIANNAFALIFVVTAGSSDLDNGTSQDNIKFFLDDDSLNSYMRSQLGTSQGTNTSGLGSLTANTTYYARITKDGTSGTIKLYSDSARTTETNSATTTFQAVSGLTHFQTGAMASGNSGNGTWVVGNLKIYDGVTSI